MSTNIFDLCIQHNNVEKILRVRQLAKSFQYRTAKLVKVGRLGKEYFMSYQDICLSASRDPIKLAEVAKVEAIFLSLDPTMTEYDDLGASIPEFTSMYIAQTVTMISEIEIRINSYSYSPIKPQQYSSSLSDMQKTIQECFDDDLFDIDTKNIADIMLKVVDHLTTLLGLNQNDILRYKDVKT